LCLKQETICTVVFNSLLVLTRSPTTEISWVTQKLVFFSEVSIWNDSVMSGLTFICDRLDTCSPVCTKLIL
jgi:hypothetical protein